MTIRLNYTGCNDIDVMSVAVYPITINTPFPALVRIQVKVVSKTVNKKRFSPLPQHAGVPDLSSGESTRLKLHISNDTKG